MLNRLHRLLAYILRPDVPDVAAPRRVLLFAPFPIVDALAALQPLHYLHSLYPAVEIGMVVPESLLSALQTHPLLHAVFPWSGEMDSRGYYPDEEALQVWKSYEPDWIIAAVPGIDSMLDYFLSPVRVGFSTSRIDSRGRSAWLTHAAKPGGGWRSWFSSIAPLTSPEPYPAPELVFTAPDHIQHNEKAILLAPGKSGKQHSELWDLLTARLIDAQWQISRFDELSLSDPTTFWLLCRQCRITIAGSDNLAALATITGHDTIRVGGRVMLWESDTSLLVDRHDSLESTIDSIFTSIVKIQHPQAYEELITPVDTTGETIDPVDDTPTI